MFSGDYQREQYAADEDAEDDGKGCHGADVEAGEFAGNHLDTDEAEQDTETVAEQPELVGHIAEEEEERTQSHDGEDVGEIDDVRVGGHGEDGGDGVDGEDDVAELYDEKH